MNDATKQNGKAVRSTANTPDKGCLCRACRAGHNGRSHSDSADDQTLLLQFIESGCHQAFEQLVARHVQWVGALIRRKIKDKHLAEDVTQAVFIILSRKADTIRPDAPLAPWLFRVTRFAIRDSMKHEQRRQTRWNRVAEMQVAGKNGHSHAKTDTPSVDLDDAIACLGESDRQAILLRFYEDLSMAEVGVAMGIGEVAAKKRVSRALKRLRTILDRNGAKVGSILVLATMLRAMARGTSAHAAVATVHATAPSLQLANSTLRSISGAHARIRTAMAGGVLAAVVAIGILSPAMGQAVVPIFQQARNAIAGVVSKFSPISLAQSFTTPTIQPNQQHTQVPVARLWIGNSNERGLPILPVGGPSNILPLQSLSGSNDPVAIVQDDTGNYWYRRVDPQAMPSFVTTRNLFEDLDLSVPPISNTYTDPSLLDMTVDFFQAADIMAKVDGKDWKQINGPGSGGTVVLPYADINGVGGLNPVISEVPEPLAVTSILALAAPLLLHRKRRI